MDNDRFKASGNNGNNPKGYNNNPTNSRNIDFKATNSKNNEVTSNNGPSASTVINKAIPTNNNSSTRSDVTNEFVFNKNNNDNSNNTNYINNNNDSGKDNNAYDNIKNNVNDDSKIGLNSPSIGTDAARTYNAVSSTVYNMTDGKIRLGSLQDGSERGGARQVLAETVYNYTTQGARDRENNSVYDNKVRYNKTMAVMSLVCHTSRENIIADAYDKIDWNDKATFDHMERMGVVSTKDQNYINNLWKSPIELVDDNGNVLKTKEGDTITLDKLASKIPIDYKNEFYATGKIRYEEDGKSYLLHIKGRDPSEVREAYNAAKMEQYKNKNAIKATSYKDKERILASIKSKQINYLKKKSYTGKFDGTIETANKEVKELDKRISDIEKKIASANNPTDEENFMKQLSELKEDKADYATFLKTGAKSERSGNAENRRSYGKVIVEQNILGDDFYRGTQFVKNSKKAITATARLAVKTTTKASAGIMTATTAIPRKVSPNSKAGLIADNLNTKAHNAKDTINEKVRYKTKDEKKQIKQNKKIENKAKVYKKREERTVKIEDHINKLTSGNLSKRELKKLDNYESQLKNGFSLTDSAKKNYTELLKKQKDGTLTTKNKRNLKISKKLQKANYINNNKAIVAKAQFNNLKAKVGNTGLGKKATSGMQKFKNSKAGQVLSNVGDKIGKGFKTLNNKVKSFHPVRRLSKIKQDILKPFNLLKKWLLKILGTLLAYYLFMIGLAFVFLIPIMALGSFFDALPSSKISNELAQINYVQVIVNDTANTLGKQLTKTAIKDAETHFLSEEGAVESRKYAWKKAVSEGSIKHIWTTEDLDKDVWDRTELSGVSANLLPITSMMHYRYNQSIDFDNYLTAKAYIYFMYVRSHSTAADEYGNVYSYDNLADCPDDSVYVTKPTYNTDTSAVDRGTEGCTNLYIHGYSANYNKAINKARAGLGDFLNLVQGALGIGHPDGSNEDNGVFIDKKPYDSKGECDNYEAFQAGVGDDYTNCGKKEHDHKKEGCPEAWFDSDGNECTKEEHNHEQDGCTKAWFTTDGDKCDIEEHIHNDDCYEWYQEFLGYNDETHEESSDCYETQWLPTKTRVYFKDCAYNNNILLDYDEYHNSDEDEYYCEDCDEYHTVDHIFDGFYEWIDVMICNGHHEHNENCEVYSDPVRGDLICGYDYEHSHEDSGENFTWDCDKEEHNHSEAGEEYTWACGIEGHIHDPWVSEDNPGCFKTAYVCMGHCGGHISPTINLSEDMTYDTLCFEDNFKTPLLLSNTDFAISNIRETYKTIDAWQNHWIEAANSWFYLPIRSPIQAIEWKNTKLFTSSLSILNWIKNKASGSSDYSYVNEDAYKMQDKDYFEFDGWTDEQSDGNWVIKKDVLQDLKDLYGDYYEDNYQNGIDNWKSFEVTFPSAINECLNDKQVSDTLKNIQTSNNLTLSEKQKAILEKGLRSVGKFYYSESKNSPNAHKNAVYSDTIGGPADASGFLIGTYRRGTINVNGYYGLLDENTNFYSEGYSGSDWKVGDIVSSADGKCAMYLGYLKNGIDDYSILTMKFKSPDKNQNKTGIYILECSKDYGGVVVRKVTMSELQSTYPHIYRPSY